MRAEAEIFPMNFEYMNFIIIMHIIIYPLILHLRVGLITGANNHMMADIVYCGVDSATLWC